MARKAKKVENTVDDALPTEEEADMASNNEDDFDSDDDAEVAEGTSSGEAAKRGPKGPRQRYFFCSAISESGGLISEMIGSTPVDRAEFNLIKAREEITQIFNERHGISPMFVSQPVTLPHVLNAPRKTRSGVTRSKKTADLEVQPGKHMAITRYNEIDWSLKFQYTDDPELAYVSNWVGPVNASEKKSKPSITFVNTKDLRNITAVEKTA